MHLKIRLYPLAMSNPIPFYCLFPLLSKMACVYKLSVQWTGGFIFRRLDGLWIIKGSLFKEAQYWISSLRSPSVSFIMMRLMRWMHKFILQIDVNSFYFLFLWFIWWCFLKSCILKFRKDITRIKNLMFEKLMREIIACE